MIAAKPKNAETNNQHAQSHEKSPECRVQHSFSNPGLKTREQARRSRLLVIAADEEVQRIVTDVLGTGLCEVVIERSQEKLKRSLEFYPHFDAVLIDIFSPVESFFDLIPLIKESSPGTEVIFVSRYDDEKLWIESIQRGA